MPTLRPVQPDRTDTNHGEGSGFAECLQICHDILDSQVDFQTMQKLQPLKRSSMVVESCMSQIGHEQNKKENAGHYARRSNCIQGRRGVRWSSRLASHEPAAENDLPKTFLLSGAQLLPEKSESRDTKPEPAEKVLSTVGEDSPRREPSVTSQRDSSIVRPRGYFSSELVECITAAPGGTTSRVKSISFPGVEHIRLEPAAPPSAPLNFDSVDDILRQHRKATVDTNVDREYSTNLRGAQASRTLLHDVHKDLGVSKSKGPGPVRKLADKAVEEAANWDTLSMVGSRVRV